MFRITTSEVCLELIHFGAYFALDYTQGIVDNGILDGMKLGISLSIYAKKL